MMRKTRRVNDNQTNLSSIAALQGKNLFLENKPLIVITAGKFENPLSVLNELETHTSQESERVWLQQTEKI